MIRNLVVFEITTSTVFLKWDEPIGYRSVFTVNWTQEKRESPINTNNTTYHITDLKP